MDFPASPGLFLPHNCIHSYGVWGPGIGLIVGGVAQASTTWPAANRAFYLPFRISAPFVAKRIYWRNGATSNGNMDAGIYDAAGTRLASIGPTAQGTINVTQSAAFSSDVLLGPGVFYLGLLSDSGTATVIASSLTFASLAIAQQSVGSGTLPATATLAQCTSSFLPVCGISTRSIP